MNNPDDEGLPLFAYGLLKPGQPPSFQIRDYVARCEIVCAPGVLLIQDGLPILKKSGTGTTEGVWATFKDKSARDAYEKIQVFEPKSIYRWDTVVLADMRHANVLYAAHPQAGNPVDWPGWDG